MVNSADQQLAPKLKVSYRRASNSQEDFLSTVFAYLELEKIPVSGERAETLFMLKHCSLRGELNRRHKALPSLYAAVI